MSHTHSHRPVADASVRLATPTDAPAVGFVQAVLWREAYASVLPPEVVAEFEPHAFTKAWRSSLESPPSRAHRLLVCCAGEQVVGFAAVGPSGDPDAGEADAEVLVLGVHPDARRAGHGSRLLNAAVDTARTSSFTGVRAWVLAADEATRTFLLDAGFAPDGAYRDRVVGPAYTDTVREVRLHTAIG